MTKRLFASLMIVLLVLTVGGVAFAAKTYRAERFDADWTVNPDGSLSVVETVVFNFEGGPFTFVFREIPSDYSDGVEIISAAMDGQALPRGGDAGQFEVEDSDGQRVTWRFAPTSDTTHTFQLEYRIRGAVRREGAEDLLFWNFLPTDYEYPINAATLRVTYPASAQRIGAPEVRRGEAAVSEGDGQVIFTANNVRPGSPLTVALRFVEGSLIAEPPAWQQRAAAVAERAPTMWALAGLLLLGGAAALAGFWRTGARPAGSVREPAMLAHATPPSKLSPALAGALLNTSGKPGAPQAMATLFSLAQRGVLTFEETAEKKWYRSAQFTMRLQPDALAAVRLDPHEAALVAGLFTEKARDEVKLTDLAGQLQKTAKAFGKAVEDQLVEKDLVDRMRAAHATRFMVVGLVLLGLVVLAGVAAVFLWRDFGGWALLLPAVVFILGIAAFVLGTVYSVRSAAGEEAALAWGSFRDYLKAVTKGREPSWDLRMFDQYFPYAATFSLENGWAKAFKDHGGVEPPAWFRSTSADGVDSMATFIVLTTASHSSTSSGGAGGGGAGGGGGSGAG